MTKHLEWRCTPHRIGTIRNPRDRRPPGRLSARELRPPAQDSPSPSSLRPAKTSPPASSDSECRGPCAAPSRPSCPDRTTTPDYLPPESLSLPPASTLPAW